MKLRQLNSDRPTVYADMNVFRYIAHGELQIANAEEFLWVYSYAHLDEIVRGTSKDAFDGMRSLKTVEICDVLSESFQSVGNVLFKGYVDPAERYNTHLDAIAGYENTSDLMVEFLLRFFGADNFAELSLSPKALRSEVERITAPLQAESRNEIVQRAKDVSLEMTEMINTHLFERCPIDQTRNAFGLTSAIRAEAEASASPIDAIWDIIQPSVGAAVSKDQFFCFEPHPAAEGVPHTQHGALAGAYTVLNLLGISPDRGLAKREKLKSIISDSQHVGMASYCHALLSADRRLCGKAEAIFKHVGSATSVLCYPYNPEGSVIWLQVKES